MNDFDQVMQNNPARVVITFQRDPTGNEQFQWGIVGKAPVLSIIGGIIKAQVQLQTSQLDDGAMDLSASRYCEPMAFVLVWDEGLRRTNWYVNKDIPCDPLVGMLETVKITLVGSRIAQHAAAQQVRILGPTGEPIR
jgi:hypothetical protein